MHGLSERAVFGRANEIGGDESIDILSMPLRQVESSLESEIEPRDSGATPGLIDAATRILIRDRGRWWFLPAGRIRLFESVGNHTFLMAEETIRVPRTLREIQE